MEPEELQKIISEHQNWLNGNGGERASLRDADLRDASLCDADLCGANLRDANLRDADLRRASLCDADLRGANLCGASLCDADLCGADLRDADLRRASLCDADLRGANLCGADLRDADLWGCTGNRNEMKSLFIAGEYPITFTAKVLQIGCKRHPIAGWWEFDDRKILEMDGTKALRFWRNYKDIIRQVIELSPANPTGKENNNE